MEELFEEYHPTTPEDALFAAGEKTGLKGPYLGQKPPGLKNEGENNKTQSHLCWNFVIHYIRFY